MCMCVCLVHATQRHTRRVVSGKQETTPKCNTLQIHSQCRWIWNRDTASAAHSRVIESCRYCDGQEERWERHFEPVKMTFESNSDDDLSCVFVSQSLRIFGVFACLCFMSKWQ